jgi:DNA-binding CsgD family transcriptional regulator
MMPFARLVSAGDGIDAVFARALPAAQHFDLAHPAKAMQGCMRFADVAHLIEVAGPNPLGWRLPVAVGLSPSKDMETLPICLGELPDQDFTRSVLLPTYMQAIAADQPVVHRITAVADTFATLATVGTTPVVHQIARTTDSLLLSYRKMTVPLSITPGARRPSHLLIISVVDVAIPQIRSHKDAAFPLTFRERQCLSLAASGLAAKQMAAEIGVSEKTIELHLACARHKLGARTTAQAVAINLAMAMMER